MDQTVLTTRTSQTSVPAGRGGQVTATTAGWPGEALLLKIGGAGAILGSIMQVAAGTASTSVSGGDAETVLASLATQPGWLLPVVYLGFIFGSLFWVGGVAALATTLRQGAAWTLVRLGLASLLVGVTLHAVDGVLHGVALADLGRAWPAAPEEQRAALVQSTDLILRVTAGTWAGVITLFHGLPFVLIGLAVALSERYPAWLGWLGILGGAGSLIVGVGMFLGLVSAFLAVPFAVVLSLFMVVLGWLLWTASEQGAADAAQA